MTIPSANYSMRLARIPPGFPSAFLSKPFAKLMISRVWDRPARIPVLPVSYFSQSEAAKARLLPALAPLNVEKTKAAPVTVIVAWDTEFYENLPRLFPHADMRSYFVGNQRLIDETAFRNSSLQGGYFILAARAVGLDCGPMSGFDPAKVNAEFFPDGKWKVNFLCNLGYGDRSKLHPRNPRLEFDEACRVL